MSVVISDSLTPLPAVLLFAVFCLLYSSVSGPCSRWLVNPTDEGRRQKEPTREGLGRLPSVIAGAHDHHQHHASFSPSENCPTYEIQLQRQPSRVQPPSWSPKSGEASKQLDEMWLMEQQPVDTGSPARVFTELLPPKTGSNPAVTTSFPVSATDDQQDSWRPEMKSVLNAKPTHGASDETHFQTEQQMRTKDQQRQSCEEDTVAEMPKTKSSDEKENVCETCCKKFASRFSLRVHIRTHTGEKPHVCAVCGKRFSQRRNYRYHLSLHSGSREFEATCPECGKVFSDRGYLSSHMKIHRDRREYGCAQCGKRFNQRVAYNMHVRTHTGERPYHCTVCDKTFTRKVLLNRHVRRHTAEKSFACQVLADHSKMAAQLRAHLAGHVTAGSVTASTPPQPAPLDAAPPPAEPARPSLSSPPSH